VQHNITIDTYHEYMCEAFFALRSGLSSLDSAQTCEEDDAQGYWLSVDANMQCRYSFLLAANSLEAAANAMLLNLDTTPSLYNDLEKLPTLLKFEFVCISLGKRLDRGKDLYAKIKEVVRCRNEFVHPKPRKASCQLTEDKKDIEIVVSKTKSRQYPQYFSLFEPKHAIMAIGDILSFLSWIAFDICGYSIKEGTMILGYGSYEGTVDIIELALKHNFDTRTFGEQMASIHKGKTVKTTT
jgi:hypothetical protein